MLWCAVSKCLTAYVRRPRPLLQNSMKAHAEHVEKRSLRVNKYGQGTSEQVLAAASIGVGKGPSAPSYALFSGGLGEVRRRHRGGAGEGAAAVVLITGLQTNLPQLFAPITRLTVQHTHPQLRKAYHSMTGGRNPLHLSVEIWETLQSNLPRLKYRSHRHMIVQARVRAMCHCSRVDWSKGGIGNRQRRRWSSPLRRCLS